MTADQLIEDADREIHYAIDMLGVHLSPKRYKQWCLDWENCFHLLARQAEVSVRLMEAVNGCT